MNPKNLILTLGAAGGLAQLGLSSSDAVVSLIAFVIVASLTIAGPVVYYLLGGAHARTKLDELKDWLRVHNTAVMGPLRTGMGRVARGPHGDPQAVRVSASITQPMPLRARTRLAMSAPAGPPSPETNIPRSPACSLRTRQTAFSESGADALAARNQERFFASRVTSWWPHVAPWSAQTALLPEQPETGPMRKCRDFLDCGKWAIQDSNLGPLPYQRNCASPPVPPTRT